MKFWGLKRVSWEERGKKRVKSLEPIAVREVKEVKGVFWNWKCIEIVKLFYEHDYLSWWEGEECKGKTSARERKSSITYLV